MKSLLIITGIPVCTNSLRAQSSAIWLTSAGGNAHRYEVLPPVDRLTWTEAQSRAQNRGGYLATITSQEENVFIGSILPYNYFNWIGGIQINPDNVTWEWVTGETWSYTNWSATNPNYPGLEKYLQIYGYEAEEPGKWNDATNDSQYGGGLFGYVVEYSEVPDSGDTLALFGGALSGLALVGRKLRRKG